MFFYRQNSKYPLNARQYAKIKNVISPNKIDKDPIQKCFRFSSKLITKSIIIGNKRIIKTETRKP